LKGKGKNMLFQFEDEHSKKVIEHILVKFHYTSQANRYLNRMSELRQLIKQVEDSDMNAMDKNIVIDHYRNSIANTLSWYRVSLLNYEEFLKGGDK
jgi:predicted SprT family Zn-dependent metalloprotease